MKKVSPVILSGIGLTVFCTALYFLNPPFIRDISCNAYDAMLRIAHRSPQSDAVVIVDIDDTSLKHIGQWPWHRYIMGELTQILFNSGAEVVAFDIVFPEPDRTSPPVIQQELSKYFKSDVRMVGIPANFTNFDSVFAEALKKGKAVLGCQMHQNKSLSTSEMKDSSSYCSRFILRTRGHGARFIPQATHITASIPELSKSAYQAFFNAVSDADGVVRSNPLVWLYGTERVYPSMALEAVRLYKGIDTGMIECDELGVVCIKIGDIKVPTDATGRAIINYRHINSSSRTGFVSTFPVFSAADVLAGSVNTNIFKGKIVFVGTSAVGLKDIKTSPISQYLSGIEIHATLVDNILAGDILQRPSWMFAVDLMAILFIGIFLTIFISKGKSWVSLFLTLLVISASIWIGIELMKNKCIVFVPSWLILTAIVIHLPLTTIKYWQEEVQKKRIRQMFGTMVSPQILSYMERHPESFSLTGRKMDVSVFFSDIAGFTTICESLPSEVLSEFLNTYLSEMTHIILNRNGLVDKYEGDLIMAEWGLPFPIADHAYQACASALEQQKKLAEIRPKLKKKFGHDVYVRIGINTGKVTAGNMGSTKRMQYTVIGDVVNEAARLEPLNKLYGTSIIIGEPTFNAIQGNLETRFLDRVIVRGKTIPLNIYELLGWKGKVQPAKIEVCALYEQALSLYMQRRWDEAYSILQKALHILPQDQPANLLLTRIQTYIKSPPPPDWQGEYIHPSH